MSDTFQVSPTHLLVLCPTPFTVRGGEEFEETHAMHWQEVATYTITPREEVGEDGILATGEVRFEGDEHTVVTIIVEEPLEDVTSLAATSAEPLTAPELILLKEHQAVWRLQVAAGRDKGRLAARRLCQVIATIIEVGACAVFLPSTLRLHAPQFIRMQTMDPYSPEGTANLFVSAWHDDSGWMRTRGLTAFGLPEIETSTKGGLNGAYFLLMDVAANMLFQMAPYPEHARLQVGPYTYSVVPGPSSDEVEDDEAPMNGLFGVHTIHR